MHTSLLRTDCFQVEVDGRPADLEQVFPSWNADDRVGVVMFSPIAAVGVSLLHQLAVAAFYDARRIDGRLEELLQDDPAYLRYPDFYLFHVGGRYGDFSTLDFLPPQKEVFLADSPDEVLQAINDRAITRLLIEERTPGDPEVEASVLASATERIRSALVFSRTGQVADGDISVRATDESVEENVRGVFDVDRVLASYAGITDQRYVDAMQLIDSRRSEVPVEVRQDVATQRAGILEAGCATETYRRVPLLDGIRLLASPTT